MEETRKVLEKLSREHQLWINMALGCGAGDEAEDIVQDMYLLVWKQKKRFKDIMYNDSEVNKYFIYLIIYYAVADNARKKKYKKHMYNHRGNVPMEDVNAIAEGSNIEEEQAFEKVYSRVYDLVDTMYWYDRKMFKIYFEKGLSMRKIAEETGISLKSVFDTITKIKNYVKEEIGEDWQDFNNEEYDKI